MALYNHVHDKDELVDLMVDLMLGEVDCTPDPDGQDWATQLRNLVCSYHQALSAHPQLARVYSSRVCLGPHGLTIIERSCSCCCRPATHPPPPPTPSSPSTPTPSGSTRWAKSTPWNSPRCPPNRSPRLWHWPRTSAAPAA